MSQDFTIKGFLFIASVLFGILLESRVFQPRRSVVATPSNPPAVSQSPAVASATALRPILQIDQPVYDFGVAEMGDRIEHGFVIKNVGTAPLTIQEIKASCGCTTAKSTASTIDPGKSTEVLAVLDLKARAGKQNSPVMIKTNDPVNDQVRVAITGTSVIRVAVMPDSVEFGRVLPPEKPQIVKTRIQVAEQLPLKILSVEANPPELSAQLEEVTPSKLYEISSTLPDNLPPGPFRGTIKVLTEHPGAYKELTIPVQAHVGPGGKIQVGDEPEISGPALDGTTADLKSYRGSVCIVAFWASWCGHCQRELPMLLELYKQHHANGLEILGVNADKETPSALAALQKLQVPWANIHFSTDSANPQPNPLMSKFQIAGIPAIYVIDRSGKVKWVGLRGTALKARVERLLQSADVTAAQASGN